MHLISFLLGLCVGVFIMSVVSMFSITYGTLRIDTSNPEKDLYRFEIDKLEDVSKKKRITLKIDPNANLSQK